MHLVLNHVYVTRLAANVKRAMSNHVYVTRATTVNFPVVCIKQTVLSHVYVTRLAVLDVVAVRCHVYVTRFGIAAFHVADINAVSFIPNSERGGSISPFNLSEAEGRLARARWQCVALTAAVINYCPGGTVEVHAGYVYGTQPCRNAPCDV